MKWIIPVILLEGLVGGYKITNQPLEKMHKYTNSLVHETSPYLLQHAHNPVNWHAWNEETLAKAKKENKLLLISIGYSSCHWCHVMEKESFEDEEVAKSMNENYVCIKVDREERPDIDQIYMTAVQLMTRQGGWPLNCIALPDGRPIYGGTYFPKEKWVRMLEQIADNYKLHPEKAIEYAEKVEKGIQQTEYVVEKTEEVSFNKELVQGFVNEFKKSFDHNWGGMKRAPKFPMPNTYQFLLRYAYITNDSLLLDYIHLTIQKIAYGGIFDQIAGGFARYSTDEYWSVPHFEKMLYDNAQLLSLYSEAYLVSENELYKDVIDKTTNWLHAEMQDKSGLFYSALDADSEGEEGKYYIWKEETLQTLLTQEQYKIAAVFYNINKHNLWENDHYVLIRSEEDQKVSDKLGLPVNELRKQIKEIDKILLEERSKRIRPGLDDKILTSWNALLVSGYVDTYRALSKKEHLKNAINLMNNLLQKQKTESGGLYHTNQKGTSKINGFLEDYCFMIKGLIDLYQVTFNENWLQEAKTLTNYALDHFYFEQSGMFFFSESDELIIRKTELYDNVIPSSNSAMANNLFLLGHYFGNAKYLDVSMRMLKNISAELPNYPSGHSNWGILLLRHAYTNYELVICGEKVETIKNSFIHTFLPQALIAGSKKQSKLNLFKNRYTEGKTYIYVCQNNACQLPVESVSEALQLME